MTTMQLWFPACLVCEKVTSFAGSKDLPPSELTCRDCGAVCQDANAMISSGELIPMPPSAEAIAAYFAATDKEIQRHRELGAPI